MMTADRGILVLGGVLMKLNRIIRVLRRYECGTVHQIECYASTWRSMSLYPTELAAILAANARLNAGGKVATQLRAALS
jgi:hypothetical protein